MSTAEVVAAAAIGAGVPGFVAGWWVRKRTKADAADILTQAATRVVTQLTSALDAADEKARRMQAEIGELVAEIEQLRALVVQLGGDPTIGRRATDRPPG